jgi:hypothetical protein
MNDKIIINDTLKTNIKTLTENNDQVQDYLNKINLAVQKINTDINQLNSENLVI